MPPETIRDAIVRALDPEFPVALSPTGRWALSILLRRVEVRNGRADFWVKRINFSALVDRCDKTVTNWLNELERAGLIVREQSRSNWGAFRCLTVRLTELAISVLHLDRPTPSPTPRKKTSHALLDNQQSKETVEVFANAKRGQLPEDLVQLEAFLPRTAVFALMGIASKSGTRLSDVVAACGENIAKARHKFAYIRKLLSVPKDFAAVATLAVAEKVAAEQEVAQKTKLQEVWESLTGYEVPSKGKVVRVGAYMQACEVYEYDQGGKRIYRGCLAGEPLTNFLLKAGADFIEAGGTAT